MHLIGPLTLSIPLLLPMHSFLELLPHALVERLWSTRFLVDAVLDAVQDGLLGMYACRSDGRVAEGVGHRIEIGAVGNWIGWSGCGGGIGGYGEIHVGA